MKVVNLRCIVATSQIEIIQKVSTIELDFLCESAWLEHGPFMYWVISELKPRTFVELGSQYGFSYFAACHSVKKNTLATKCFAVDTWQGDEQAGYYGDKEFLEVKKYNEENFKDFSTLLRTTFYSAVEQFQENSIDLLHIDGFHSYEAVSEDFNNWKSRLSDNAIVLFHDIHEYREDFGVHIFWKELKSSYTTFEFTHEHGLGVLKFGKGPTQLDFLFESENFENLDTFVRFIFRSAGAAATVDYKLSAKDQIINKYYSDSMNYLAETESLKEQNSILQLTLSNFKKSLSWKLTRPLRTIKRFVVR